MSGFVVEKVIDILVGFSQGNTVFVFCIHQANRDNFFIFK
jgi:hypothetical protein